MILECPEEHVATPHRRTMVKSEPRLSAKEMEKLEKEKKKRKADDLATSKDNLAAIEEASGCNTAGLLLESCIREARALGDMATFVLFKKKVRPPDVRAQMPGWDPVLCRTETLDSYSAAFAALRKEEIALAKKRHVPKNGVLAKTLRGPGPPRVTAMDIAKVHARCAGLTVQEWCDEKKKRDDKLMWQKRDRLKRQESRVMEMANDPRPRDSEFVESSHAMIAERLGCDDAADKSQRKERTMKGFERRIAAMVMMEAVYCAQALGLKEFQMDNKLKRVSHNVAWAPSETMDQRDLLIAERTTHIVNVSNHIPNRFADDFLYCRVRVKTNGEQPMDALYEEYEMAVRFIIAALDHGGRVVVFCPNGIDSSACLLLAYFMMEKGIPLNAGYKILKTHEPHLLLSRSNALFITLFEIEVTRRTSIKKHKAFKSPLFSLVSKYVGWTPSMPLGVYYALGMIVLPDPKAFLFGRSKFRKVLDHVDPLAEYKPPPLAKRVARRVVAFPRKTYAAARAAYGFVKRGGRPEPRNVSRYLKAYYDRLEDEKVHGGARRSLVRTQKFHIVPAGSSSPASPASPAVAPLPPGAPITVGRKPSLAPLVAAEPLRRASSAPSPPPPTSRPSLRRSKTQRAGSVKRRATSMTWDTGPDDASQGSGASAASCTKNMRQSSHWRAQKGTNEESSH